jgi:primosomal protein N' (replication factor Y)
VVVDVLAVERAFDYLVPEAMASAVSVGTIVRVGLSGRRVRGWVVADGVEPEAPPERLRPLLAVVSAGPPPEVVDLTAWAARRFAGPRLPLLRSASPAALIPPGPPVPARLAIPRGTPPPADPEAAALAAEAAGAPVVVIRWPPATDVTPVVIALLSGSGPGSTLVIDPDPKAAATLAGRLEAAGRRVVRYAADGRPAERARSWDRARRGSCVVVGGRSAVLAPVPDLTTVVLLDDGAEALKEERSPAWHARDLAIERARRVGARAVLVSPAPPLEAVASAPVVIPSRATERSGWPVIEVVDRRREPPGLGLFSSRLVDALRQAVETDTRAVCVLNRRGRARLLACDACAELARCERCHGALGEGDDKSLACAACGEVRPRVCARCGGTRMRNLRAGVTRVREELAALLPGADVAMVDAAAGDIPEVPVIIGTEAVLHRVDEAGVVAFLDFDQELLAPRFRAGEQALWLLVRAARLVGPRPSGRQEPGRDRRVLVQTRLPRHEVLDAAVRGDPGVLVAAEGPRRRLLHLPPYAALAHLTGDAPALAVAAGELALAGVEASATSGTPRTPGTSGTPRTPGTSGTPRTPGTSGTPRTPGTSGTPRTPGTSTGLLVRAPTHRQLSDALALALAAARPRGRIRAEVDPLRV